MNTWVSAMSRLNWMASQLSTFEGTEYAARRVSDLADQFERDIQARMMMSPLTSALPTSPVMQSPMQSPPVGFYFDNYTPDFPCPDPIAPSGRKKSKGKNNASGI